MWRVTWLALERSDSQCTGQDACGVVALLPLQVQVLSRPDWQTCTGMAHCLRMLLMSAVNTVRWLRR